MDKGEQKTKVIRDIESKMDELDPESLRYKVLDGAREFKSSWIKLGQALYTVWKDKHFRGWGYAEFEVYTKKEIGIRSETALKLLRSYNFLEEKEPKFIKENLEETREAAKIPTYEAVDVVRRASRRKDIDPQDFEKIKDNVLEKGKDAKEAALEMNKYVHKEIKEVPEGDLKQQKIKRVKRFVGLLKSVRKEVLDLDILPKKLMKDMDKVLEELEAELGNRPE